jgi:hypothetical protein
MLNPNGGAHNFRGIKIALSFLPSHLTSISNEIRVTETKEKFNTPK